jgi:hypothetical protein
MLHQRNPEHLPLMLHRHRRLRVDLDLSNGLRHLRFLDQKEMQPRPRYHLLMLHRRHRQNHLLRRQLE